MNLLLGRAVLLVVCLGAFVAFGLVATDHIRPLNNGILLSFSHLFSTLKGLRGHQRYLRQEAERYKGHAKKDRAFGDVTVDFYRTYQEKQILGITYREYSISEWRVKSQLDSLNFWYDGRINFEMGDIYPFEDPSFAGEVSCGEKLFDLAASDEIRNASRISALYVTKLQGRVNGCAPYDIPLGGLGIFAPVVLIGMSNENLLFSNSNLGLQNFAGATISHEIGHLVGYEHPTDVEEGVATYSLCGEFLRYPQFSDTTDEFFSKAVLRNDQFWDEVSGELYKYKDWNGRTNVMAPFRVYHAVAPWDIKIFNKGYKEIFQKILQCWFSQSAENMNNSTTTNGQGTPQKRPDWDTR